MLSGESEKILSEKTGTTKKKKWQEYVEIQFLDAGEATSALHMLLES